MKKRLLFLCSTLNKNIGMFKDLEGREDVDMGYISAKKLSFPFNIVEYVFIGSKVNRHIQLPFKHLWYRRELPAREIKEYSHILVYADTCLCGWMPLLKKAKKEGVIVDAFLFDSMDVPCRSMINTKYIINNNLFQFNKIYTFDPGDAKKYGFVYAGVSLYSKQKVVEEAGLKHQSSLYFTGELADSRRRLVMDIHEIMISNHVDMLFEIVNASMDGVGIKNIEWQPYSKILEKVSGCKCILDVRRGENQLGPSLRYFEAVCYNKKLLTNNPCVVDLPYYDPKYMQVFNNPSDIDIDWLKEDCTVDYGYKGDFSPNILIDRIKRVENL